MSGIGKNTFAMKRHVKWLKAYHRYARWTCNGQCHSLGMISINHGDKIQFIKNVLSKDSWDNFLLTLETYPNRDMHRLIHDLCPHFHKEHAIHNLKNLTKKDLVC
jgi:hypothetical protein